MGLESYEDHHNGLDRQKRLKDLPGDIDNPIPLVQGRMNFETLKDVMGGVFGYFTGTDGYLSDHVDTAPL